MGACSISKLRIKLKKSTILKIYTALHAMREFMSGIFSIVTKIEIQLLCATDASIKLSTCAA